VYFSSTPLNFSNDGGKTIGNATVGIHVDHHAMWIDPNDPNHVIVGTTAVWRRRGTRAQLGLPEQLRDRAAVHRQL